MPDFLRSQHLAMGTVATHLGASDDELEAEMALHLAAQELQRIASDLLPAFKARFLRKGLMEPWTFRVRTGFESHPDGETVEEDLWVEVLTWEEGVVVGKLVDGSAHTTEWRKGAQVELQEENINAIALVREGRVLDEDELRSALVSERPQ